MERTLILQSEGIEVYLLPEKGESSNTYLIIGKEGIYMIDPSHQPEDLLTGEPERVRRMFATHGHYDHVLACDIWRKEYKNVKFTVHRAEQEHFTKALTNVSWLFGHDSDYAPADSVFENEEEIELEVGLSLHPYHTPGHTPGSTCYLLKINNKACALFTGDTLFKGTVGRVDFPGGSAKVMSETIAFFNHLLSDGILPPSLPIFPGHGEGTTLEFECRHNVFLTGLIKP